MNTLKAKTWEQCIEDIYIYIKRKRGHEFEKAKGVYRRGQRKGRGNDINIF